jgi:hypothetical protein
MQDNADNDARSYDKKRGHGDKLVKLSRTDHSHAAENHSHKRKATEQHARKSKRVTERCAKDNQGGTTMRGVCKDASGKNYEDRDYMQEDPTSSDESILEGKKPKRESVGLLVPRKHSTRNNHNCSVESFKDALSGPVASIIDISGGLVSTLSQS